MCISWRGKEPNIKLAVTASLLGEPSSKLKRLQVVEPLLYNSLSSILLQAFFDGYIDKEKFNGHLFGLGSETSNGYSSISNQNNNNATSDT